MEDWKNGSGLIQRNEALWSSSAWAWVKSGSHHLWPRGSFQLPIHSRSSSFRHNLGSSKMMYTIRHECPICRAIYYSLAPFLPLLNWCQHCCCCKIYNHVSHDNRPLKKMRTAAWKWNVPLLFFYMVIITFFIYHKPSSMAFYNLPFFCQITPPQFYLHPPCIFNLLHIFRKFSWPQCIIFQPCLA